MGVYSDIDLLVVLPDQVDRRLFMKQFYKNRTRIAHPLDIVFKNKNEVFDSTKANESFFLQAIKEDLVEIYPNWKLHGQ